MTPPIQAMRAYITAVRYKYEHEKAVMCIKAAAARSILMPKRDGIARKRKKDVFSDLSSFGSDDLSNFAAILSRNVSRSHTDYRKSSSASHKKVRSKKDERSSNVVDDEGKPSAKPKAAVFTKSESRTSARVSGVANASTSDQMHVRICQKEGCNNILTGNRIIRCEKHENKCKREGCEKKKSLCVEQVFAQIMIFLV